MCGRYAVVTKLKAIQEAFQIDVSEVVDNFVLNPNISAGDQALVISSDQPTKAQLYEFGFTPDWASKKSYVINARSEGDFNKENAPDYKGGKGIVSKPMFRKAIRSQRCIIIADAFVEGPTKEKLKKPYLVYCTSTKRPLALAGIWDEWTNPSTGERSRSFAILTTPACPLLQQIPHHRSPLILRQEDEQRWLDANTPLGEITDLMTTFDDEAFNAYPISPMIRSAKDKGIDLLQPTGALLRKENDSIFYNTLGLQEMGEASAQKRKPNSQLDLFGNL